MKARRQTTTQRRPVSDVLLDVIRARGLTPTEVADKAGLAPPIVSRFMGGTRGLTLDSADSVAAALGLELREVRRGRVKIGK